MVFMEDTVFIDGCCPVSALQTQRTDWVLKWPGQVVIAGCQTFWTTEVSEALRAGDIQGIKVRLDNQVRKFQEKKTFITFFWRL